MNTAHKISAARVLASALIGMGMRPKRQSIRKGINYELDIREGIDLSLFLFGSFQRHITNIAKRVLPTNAIVLDVGANIGAVTLPLAAHLTRGHVYAIEPTEFALAKLRRNLDLNPQVADRVTIIQTFLADTSREESDLTAYSSWPVVGNASGSQHPVHRGVPMEARCGQLTIDALATKLQLNAISLIKVDTDGHEFAVLSGAADCMVRYRPLVIFEACEYLMRPPRPTFEDFDKLCNARAYSICDGGTWNQMNADMFRTTCPAGGGLDLLAVPDEQMGAGAFRPA